MGSCKKPSIQSFNFSFEDIDSTGIPTGWNLYLKKDRGLSKKEGEKKTSLDSIIHKDGKYSLKIEMNDSDSIFSKISRIIQSPSSGKSIRFSGFIKTQHVDKGFAGLWLRIEDKNGRVLYFDNMYNNGIKGTSDWKQYSIETSFDSKVADKIVVGALIVGEGKMWVDDLNLYIDNNKIENLILKNRDTTSKENAFQSVLKFSDSTLNQLGNNIPRGKVEKLAKFCKFWGVLKYHHPSVRMGMYNWDSTLFATIPQIISSLDINEKLLEYRLLESIQPTPGTAAHKENQVFKTGDLSKRSDDIFNKKVKLILESCQYDQTQHYIEIDNKTGKPNIINEFNYEDGSNYPTSSLRLLALFRYWNIIEYFYPYKTLIKEKWDSTLTKFIPLFLKAKDKNEYLLTWHRLVCDIHDSHAFVSSPIIDSIKGYYITPFQAKFIENKLVVTGFYSSIDGENNKIRVGDIVTKIDNVEIKQLVEKYMPFTAGSNFGAQLRDLSSYYGFLLRSNTISSKITIQRGNKSSEILVKRILLSAANRAIDWTDAIKYPSFQLLSKDIGYINAGKIIESSFDSIKALFKNTKGLIFDLRCYPKVFMPFTYGAWLKNTYTPFAYLYGSNLNQPGTFTRKFPIYNGKSSSNESTVVDTSNRTTYKGRVVILVNSITQSSAEYTTMALSSVPNSIVIGSTTAGADGDVSVLSLPGNIKTGFSGLAVFYPDMSETQRVGVKINILIKPKIQNLKNGYDEYLKAALKVLNNK